MPESHHPAEQPGTPQVTAPADQVLNAEMEPYRAAPDSGAAPGVIGCVFCTHTKFRRSRVRIHDLRELLLLRYPMRCMRCNQRQYGYFLTAAFALAPRSQNGRVARGQDTWQAWTETEANAHSLQRPMTTSIGTRATKLQKRPERTATPQPQNRPEWRDDDRQIW